jgi:hypothetical protein
MPLDRPTRPRMAHKAGSLQLATHTPARGSIGRRHCARKGTSRDLDVRTPASHCGPYQTTWNSTDIHDFWGSLARASLTDSYAGFLAKP